MVPCDWLPSHGRGRQARHAGPEFLRPMGTASMRCPRLEIDSRLTGRRGQGIQADGAAVDGKPMRQVRDAGLVRIQPAQQCLPAKAVELRNAQQPGAQKLIGKLLRNEG